MPADSNALVVRSVLPADVVDVARIYVESSNAGYGDLEPKRVLDSARIERWRADLAAPPPHRWWVAVRDDEIVGFAGIGPSRDPIDARLGELDTIAVQPGHWRTGVGRALMSRALHYLSADGYGEAIVWTLANYPRGARFYESTGWMLTDEVRENGRHVSYRRKLRSQ